MHVLSGKKEGKKQVLPFVKEWMRWVCINTIKEGLNGRCSKNLTLKFKLKPLGEKGLN